MRYLMILLLIPFVSCSPQRTMLNSKIKVTGSKKVWISINNKVPQYSSPAALIYPNKIYMITLQEIRDGNSKYELRIDDKFNSGVQIMINYNGNKTTDSVQYYE